MPNNRKAEVISITINEKILVRVNRGEKEVLSAKPGENVNVKLKGISDTNVFRG